MAEKKSIFGNIVLFGAVAAAGVAVYLKREQLRQLVDDLVSKKACRDDDDIFSMEPDDDEQDEIVVKGAEPEPENDIVLKSEDLVSGDELENEADGDVE